MRCVALLCSVLAVVIAAAATDAQAQTGPAKPAAAQKKSAAARKPAPAPDTRPRMRRDDTPAPVAAAPARPVAKKKKSHAARTAPEAAQPGAEKPAPSARATPRDVAACAQSRDAELAIGGCTRIIEDTKQKPKSRAAAYYNRANAERTKGDHDAAIADYDEAIKLEPKNARAYNNRGSTRNRKGEADQAIEDFSAAIKQDARFASAYFNRANAYAAKGETEQAIEDYTKALKLNRRNVNAYIARGALYLATGASAKARADMKLAARLDRKNAYALLWQDIAERRANQKGPLGKAPKGLDMKAWPAPVLRLYAGELQPDAVLAEADNPAPALKEAHTCEANFYSGEFALIGGNREEAVKLFRLAAKDCPNGFLEGIAAAAELKGMGEKSAAN